MYLQILSISNTFFGFIQDTGLYLRHGCYGRHQTTACWATAPPHLVPCSCTSSPIWSPYTC